MKFELLKNDCIQVPRGKNVIKLYRIIAMRDIPNPFAFIAKHTLGGYVESADNLDSNDNSWIGGNAQVFGNAVVTGNSLVDVDSVVYGSDNNAPCTIIHSMITNNAIVTGTSTITNSILSIRAGVSGNAIINDTRMRGSSVIMSKGNLTVRGCNLSDIAYIKAQGLVDACTLSDAGGISSIDNSTLTVTHCNISGTYCLQEDCSSQTLSFTPDLQITKQQ